MNLEIFPDKAFDGEVVNNLLSEEDDGDRHDARRYYHQRTLDRVTHETLCKEYGPGWWSGHNFLLPEAFVFFLPALVEVALTCYERQFVDQLADSLVLNLWDMSFDENDARTRVATERYTDEQLSFFSRFLVRMAEDRYAATGDQDNASPALERFWGKFLS